MPFTTHSATQQSGYRRLRINYSGDEDDKLPNCGRHHRRLSRSCKRLTSIPGIADVTTAKLLAEIPSLERFEGAPRLAAYAGLTPSQHQSGSSVFRRGRLTKTGNAHLRRALYMPALVALRWNPVIQVLAERLRERGKHKMVIVGAVIRKLLHISTVDVRVTLADAVDAHLLF